MEKYQKDIAVEAADRIAASNLVVAAAILAAADPIGTRSIHRHLDELARAFKVAHEMTRSD